MRIQVLSDFHVDVRPGYTPELAAGADVVIVAGDVCEGPANGMEWLRRHIPLPTPIIMVAGNHEFYNYGLLDERAAAADTASIHGITFLDDSSAISGGVRFIGATLWTDFKLFGEAQRQISMIAAGRFMSDFSHISLRGGDSKPFTPAASVRLHEQSVAYLDATLAKSHDGPTVVVTHHAPHPLSVAEKYSRDPVTPAFASDLSALIAKHAPALWVHGHTHTSFDYHLGDTRVVCNPKGYGRENRAFDPSLIVEV